MIRRLFFKSENFSAKLKQLTGIAPSNTEMYQLAFRHSSVSEKEFESNERLEFLGDAVLSAVIADFLFKKFPYKNEGYLTDIRSKMVSRNQLNAIAHKMGIDQFIKFTSSDPMLNTRQLSGNALEALVGAVYLDKGFKAAEQFILRKIVKPFIDLEEIEITEFNYKSKLLEWTQKSGKALSFEVIHHSRNRNHSLYKIAAMIDGAEWGMGEDTNKKNAEKQAAKNAFVKLNISVEEFM